MLINQLPSNLVTEAVKLPVNIIIHQLSHQDERELVGKHARCTDAQIEHIGGMERGEAVVFLEGEGEPKNVKIFPLARLIATRLSETVSTDEMVRDRMRAVFQQFPELAESEPLPESILKRFTKSQTEDPKTKEDNPYQEIQKNDKFIDMCIDMLQDENEEGLNQLALFIHMTDKEHSDGNLRNSMMIATEIIDGYCSYDKDSTLQHVLRELSRLNQQES